MPLAGSLVAKASVPPRLDALSPAANPTYDTLKVGSLAPKILVALLASTVNVALLTVSEPLTKVML